MPRKSFSLRQVKSIGHPIPIAPGDQWLEVREPRLWRQKRTYTDQIISEVAPPLDSHKAPVFIPLW